MRIGSVVKSAEALGMLLAIAVFVGLRVVLEVNTFLSMIAGLVIGLVFVFICERFKEEKK